MAALIGKSLGRYHILEQLGQGGMAVVYKAYDNRLERDVAVKIIRRGAFPPDQLARILRRFEREAKVLAKLIHPNIVPVVDYGEFEDEPFLVMPHLPGGTLKDRLGKPIPWEEAIRLLVPIARALSYAHEQGVIHRDVKPSNILITQSGEPMLTDFGIAKILLDTDATSDLTGTGIGVGTPEYMSPEQFQNKGIDARTDIYSLGVVLFELITGGKPYEADTPAAVLVKQVTTPLPKLGKTVRGIPESMEKVVAKALARNTNDRFPNMTAFADNMEGLLQNSPLTRRRIPKVDRKKSGGNKKKDSEVSPKPASPKHPNLVRSLILLVSSIGLLGLVWMAWGTFGQKDRSQVATGTNPVEELTVLPNNESKAALSPSVNLEASPTPEATPTPNPFIINPPDYAISRIGKGTVYAMKFSPNGETLAISTGSGVYLYHFEDMQLEEMIPDISPYIAFSSDGSQLAIGQNLWDIQSMKVVDPPGTIPSGELLGAAFRDSTPIISKLDASTGNVLELWNMMTGQKIGDVYRNLNSWRGYMPVFSPDGKFLAILAEGSNVYQSISPGRIEILDTFTREVIEKIDGNYTQATFSNDNSFLFTINDWDFGVLVYNLIEHRRIYQFESSYTNNDYGDEATLAVSPDGKLLASFQPPDIIKIWDLESGKEVANLTGIFSDVFSFSPDGQYLVIADSINLNVLDWRTSKIIRQTKGFGLPIRSMSGSSSDRLYVNLDQKFFLDVNLENGSLATVDVVKSPIRIGLVSPDGSLVAGIERNEAGNLILWNPETNELTYKENPDPLEIVFPGQTENIYAYQYEQQWYFSYFPVYSADGKLAASCETNRDWNQQYKLLNSSSLSIIQDIDTHRQIKTINGCDPVFSMDGTLIATSAGAVMDSRTGDVLYTFNGFSSGNNIFTRDEDPYYVTHKAFLPDNASMALGLRNGNLILVSLAIGSQRIFEGHSAAITSMVFFPEKQWMATGSNDGTIIIWDLKKMIP